MDVSEAAAPRDRLIVLGLRMLRFAATAARAF